MRFKVAEFFIDDQLGEISHQDQTAKLRPKSMQVLIYLLERPNQRVSKQQLLDAIWDDVVVQEQVLFQSIKEIRDSFKGLDVIKTHPRKGYEWIAGAQALAKPETSPELGTAPSVLDSLKPKYRPWLAGAVILCLLTVLGLLWPKSESDKPLARDGKLELAVLPIINTLPAQTLAWASLGGMDLLINQLRRQSAFSVLDTDAVLFALERTASYGSVRGVEQEQARIEKIRQALGPDVVVETKLLGAPHDFQLHYQLISRFGIDRGVIFSQTLPEALASLAQQISAQYGHNLPEQKTLNLGASQFSSEAFMQGVEHYLLQEYAEAEPYLRATLASSPDNLAARRYLASSLAHQDKLDEGLALLEDNIVRAKAMENRREEVRASYLLGRWLSYWRSESEAQPYVERARELAEDYDDLLFISYAYEQQGRSERILGNYAQARQWLEKALSYQETFGCPYGMSGVYIELASTFRSASELPQAEDYFAQALSLAERHELLGNQVWALLESATLLRDLGQQESAQAQVHEAQKRVTSAGNRYLEQLISDWRAGKPVSPN